LVSIMLYVFLTMPPSFLFGVYITEYIKCYQKLNIILVFFSIYAILSS